jgi:hypothetical protein
LKLEHFFSIARLAHRKSRSLSKANWKVKAHQLSGENPEVLSRLSHQAGVMKISI